MMAAAVVLLLLVGQCLFTLTIGHHVFAQQPHQSTCATLVHKDCPILHGSACLLHSNPAQSLDAAAALQSAWRCCCCVEESAWAALAS